MASKFLKNKNIRIENVQNYSKVLNTFKKSNTNKIIANTIKGYC